LELFEHERRYTVGHQYVIGGATHFAPQYDEPPPFAAVDSIIEAYVMLAGRKLCTANLAVKMEMYPETDRILRSTGKAHRCRFDLVRHEKYSGNLFVYDKHDARVLGRSYALNAKPVTRLLRRLPGQRHSCDQFYFSKP
jgi:hypothetical protein